MNYIDELEREKNHADSMAAAAEMWMHRALQAEKNEAHLVAALVHAAGGKIEVSLSTLTKVPNLELTRDHCPANMIWTFRTRAAPATVGKEQSA